MANCCDYEIHAVSKNKESLERLLKILEYKDNEFFIHRVQNVKMFEKPNQGYWSDLWVAKLMGNVAWDVEMWVVGEPDSDRKIETGASFTNLLEICKKLDMAIEIWAEEICMGFQRHVIVGNDGVLKEDDYKDWDGSEESGFGEKYMECSSPDDLYLTKPEQTV